MFETDITFYFTAIPAVLIYGISKGGLGGALGTIAIPLMTMTTAPARAAAILLPILLVMDVIAIACHHRHACWHQLRQMLPGALAGIALAAIFMKVVSPALLAGAVGVLCVLFAIQFYCHFQPAADKAASTARATFWSMISGISSTLIHAGGGPASIYLLPLKLPKETLIATMAVFFGVVNLVKLIPYWLMEQLNSANLATATLLMPLALLGVWLGVKFLNRASHRLIYQICHFSLLLSGLKLIVDSMN
ncbi:sulfite exporter TauE/SafE family protein [Salinimonas lutimaris]|uniref:sulfite exporter TauE/SafE family protein n=1 Tax=Salinimonas lutimaris TaxID=914153 RepID=UPI0010C10329|nr:sulfite exporter TauE/SafE family protein [Salinimonas lutimaris]